MTKQQLKDVGQSLLALVGFCTFVVRIIHDGWEAIIEMTVILFLVGLVLYGIVLGCNRFFNTYTEADVRQIYKVMKQTTTRIHQERSNRLKEKFSSVEWVKLRKYRPKLP